MEDDRAQNYLVLQPTFKYFKRLANINTITEWKSKGFLNNIIKPPKSTNSLNRVICYNDSAKIPVNVSGSYLKQDNFFLLIKQY